METDSSDTPPDDAGGEGGQHVLENLTPHHIAISGKAPDAGIVVRIGPWGRVTRSTKDVATIDLKPWTDRSIVQVHGWETPPVSWVVFSMAGVVLVAMGALAVRVVLALPFFGVPAHYWGRTLWLMVIAAVLAPVFVFADWSEKRPLRPGIRMPALRQAALVSATLVVVVLISIGLPLGVIISDGSWRAVPCHAPVTETGTVPTPVESPIGLLPGEANPAAAAANEAGWVHLQDVVACPFRWVAHQNPHRLVGSGLQLMFITTLALLPALFYFEFNRQKLTTLRKRFFRSVVVLDPTVRTLRDAESVYGDRAGDILGTPFGQGGRGGSGGARLVVLLTATLLVTLGWITTLNPLSVKVSDGEPSVLAYFSPEASPFVYAFLGAYVFGIGMLFRRYVRSDLTPEAYAQFAVRMISAVLFAWAVLALPWGGVTRAAAAMVGPGTTTEVAQAPRTTSPSVASPQATNASGANADVPGDSGATAGVAGAGQDPAAGANGAQDAAAAQAQEAASGTTEPAAGGGGESQGTGWLALAFLIGFFPETGLSLLKRSVATWTRVWVMQEEKSIPLERLEGINVYHQSRLLDEGVENVENLAHADIIELMLDTRIPLPTLVDWIDQAILLVHVPDRTDQDVLHASGVRTATDLEAAYDAARARDPENAEGFLQLLASPVAGAPPRLRSVLDALADDQWMRYLRRCREDDVVSGGPPLDASMLPVWDQGDDALQRHLRNAKRGLSPSQAARVAV